MKLYFLTGLPTETDEDTLGIAELARRLRRDRPEAPHERRRSRCRSAASCPSRSRRSSGSGRTPSAELQPQGRTCCATSCAATGACSSSGTTPRPRVVEGIASRGDRRLGPVIEDVWRDGGTFQEWSRALRPRPVERRAWPPRPVDSTGTSTATAPRTRCCRGTTSRPACTRTSSGRTGATRSPRSASRTAAGRLATTAARAPATASSTSWPRPSPPAGGSQGTGQDLSRGGEVPVSCCPTAGDAPASAVDA